MEFNQGNQNFGEIINVGGHKIAIIHVDNFHRDTDKYGEWRPSALQILVDAHLPPSMKDEIIMHELLEAITSIYDIKIKHHKLSVLSVVLHHVLTEN